MILLTEQQARPLYGAKLMGPYPSELRIIGLKYVGRTSNMYLHYYLGTIKLIYRCSLLMSFPKSI